MGLLRWFTKNWANTAEPTHADLRPLEWPGVTAVAAGDRVREAVRGLRSWAVAGEGGSALTLTRKTGVMRFVDDITLTLSETPVGVLIHAESRSRVGKGDLGQNRRNILELWRALSTKPGAA